MPAFHARRRSHSEVAELSLGMRLAGWSKLTAMKKPKSLPRPLLKIAWPNWQDCLLGVLGGATLALFIAPVMRLIHWAKAMESKFLIHTAWPNHAGWLLGAIALALLALLAPPCMRFLKKLWRSWRAGVYTGIGIIWFLCFAAAGIALSSSLAASAAFALVALLATFLAGLLRYTCLEPLSVGSDQDSPIEHWRDDRLGRRQVVERLAQAAVVDRASVIALLGSFGDGKTSTLNLLEHDLQDELFLDSLQLGNSVWKKAARGPQIIVVRFSSWLAGDENGLIANLFNTIVRGLETQFLVPRIRTGLIRYARALTGAVPKFGEFLKEIFAEPSQREQFESLKTMIESLRAKVVVLVDEVDRLRRGELEVLLKLIRGASEFSNVSYVCAFHKAALVRELSASSCEDDRRYAEDYLEKFFPIQVPLPKIDSDFLAQEFKRRMADLYGQEDLLRDEEESKAFVEAIAPLLVSHIPQYLSNLRRLKLFFNRVSSSIKPVAREVNLFDFIVLQLLWMNSEETIEEIFTNRRYFYYPTWHYERWMEIVHIDRDEARKQRKGFVDGILATFRRKIAVFDPAILCSEGDGNYLAVSFGPRSTIPGAGPLTTCWLAVGPGDGRC
jgi:hypothetical protein